MLGSISIRDFVIVDRLDLDFGSGFNVLTGETGAGKSILLDALGLLLGERASPGLIRPGAERAELAATFEFDPAGPLTSWLDDNDCADEPGLLLLRRVVDTSGRSRAAINGRPATLAQLREATEQLVNVHGQNAHLMLTRPEVQREFLDRYAAADGLAQAVAAAFRDWHGADAALRNWQASAAAWTARLLELRHDIAELEPLAGDRESLAELEAERDAAIRKRDESRQVAQTFESLCLGEHARNKVLKARVAELEAASGGNRPETPDSSTQAASGGAVAWEHDIPTPHGTGRGVVIIDPVEHPELWEELTGMPVSNARPLVYQAAPVASGGGVIRDMTDILRSNTAAADEKHAAMATLVEAVCPGWVMTQAASGGGEWHCARTSPPPIGQYKLCRWVTTVCGNRQVSYGEGARRADGMWGRSNRVETIPPEQWQDLPAGPSVGRERWEREAASGGGEGEQLVDIKDVRSAIAKARVAVEEVCGD